jgi:hypothetical protein
VSKLNMNDDELFDYFFARLQGNKIPMACASMECKCLSILVDDNVSKAVALYLVWFEKNSSMNRISAPSQVLPRRSGPPRHSGM